MGRTTMTKRRKKKQRQTTRFQRQAAASSGRRKPCPFHKAGVEQIDYKQVDVLRQFVSDKGKIRGRRVTGCCRRHQQQLAVAVKRGRMLAMLPYVGR